MPKPPPFPLQTTTGSLSDTRDKLKANLDELDQERERCHSQSRDLRRAATQAMRWMHQGKLQEAEDLLHPLVDQARSLSQWETQFRFLRDQLQEYAEAHFLLALLQGKALPVPEELGISPQSWLLGLSDAIGEIRRIIVRMDPVTQGQEQQQWVKVMEELWSTLAIFDHTDAILPLRSKQDQMRATIDKTASEVMLLSSQARLSALLQKES